MFSNREDVKSLTGHCRNQRNFGTACPTHDVPTLEVSSEIKDSLSYKKLCIVPASPQIFIPFHLCSLSSLLDWAVISSFLPWPFFHLLRSHSHWKCLPTRSSGRTCLAQALLRGTRTAYTLRRNQRSLHQTAVVCLAQKMAAAVLGKYLLMFTTNVSKAVL